MDGACDPDPLRLDGADQIITSQLLQLHRVHQSGVNGLEASWVDPKEGLLALSSAGDDQAIVVTLMRLASPACSPDRGAGLGPEAGRQQSGPPFSSRPEAMSLEVIGSCVRLNAHSSAIKAIAMVAQEPGSDLGTCWVASILTTGLDQRVRLWSLNVSYAGALRGGAAGAGVEHGHDMTLSLLESAITEVLEPSALFMAPADAGLDVLLAAVGGRGVETLEIRV
jgi:hypothetical protein